jgi:uncharacterized protein (DUF1330 family)
MAKAYWITSYSAITDARKVAEYGKLAGPAILAGGGRFLARGPAAFAYEHGLKERVVISEFPDLAAASSTHDGAAYQAALAVLGDGAARDVRIVEGI